MPLQNRVLPDGELIFSPARGTLMGNRGGRFHEYGTKRLSTRRWASRQWICCEIAFRNRHRAVWGRGYTELFFCDEVTALAAGHRPCFECRRVDAIAFSTAIQRGLNMDAAPRADAMDMILHAERLAGRRKRLYPAPARLPDGAIIVQAGQFLAVRHDRLLHWTFEGYAPSDAKIAADAQLVTPPAIVAALQAGYAPRWHESVFGL